MSSVIASLDAVAAVALLASLVFVLRARTGLLLSKGIKLLLLSASLVFLFNMVSNVLEHAFNNVALDGVEDYVEILFLPLLAYCLHAVNAHATYVRERRSSEMCRRQYDLLLQIIDISPVGTLVVDDYGKINFASEGAKRALDLKETSDGFADPDWQVLDADGRLLEHGFGGLNPGGADQNLRLYLSWPDRTRSRLLVSAAAMADRNERVGGYVIALEDVQARMAALGS